MKRSARRSQTKPRAPSTRVKTLTPRQIKAAFAIQRQARKERLQKKRAVVARETYKARKSDRGKLILIGVSGQHSPEKKGRKAYLIYVTKTGKKWLVRQHGTKEPFKPRKLTDIEPPSNRQLRRAVKDFQRSRRVLVSEHRAAIKGTGKVKAGGSWDFNDKMVAKIARSLKRTIESQASKRTFLISAMVLVRLPNGETQTFQVELPIDKPDHISVAVGGLENFVRQKFYAFMARELAYAGYVTSGSANHIRRLADNAGADESDYVDKRGEPWHGAGMDIVTIQQIDWRVEQIK